MKHQLQNGCLSPNRNRIESSQEQTSFLQGTGVHECNENTERAPDVGHTKASHCPTIQLPKHKCLRAELESNSLPITFYFQTSSACSEFPELHNFHYKCVWTQITLSRFQEASEAESVQLHRTQSYYFIRWSQGVAFSPICKADISKTGLPSVISYILCKRAEQGNGMWWPSPTLMGQDVHHPSSSFCSTWGRPLCFFTP